MSKFDQGVVPKEETISQFITFCRLREPVDPELGDFLTLITPWPVVIFVDPFCKKTSPSQSPDAGNVLVTALNVAIPVAASTVPVIVFM